jgi:mRNA interferase HigB
MKVHLIRKETIEEFALENVQSKKAFEEWLTRVKHADWEMPTDIQNTFPAADLLGKSSNRVIFDIGGNNYRMICKYLFGEKQVHLFICWIGKHSDYDKLTNGSKQYSIHLY